MGHVLDMQATNQQNKRYYDSEARQYDEHRYQTLEGQRVDAFHKLVLQELLIKALPAQASILELGCGTGRLTEYVSKQQECEIFGVDLSGGMLQLARDRLKRDAAHNAHLTLGSISDLPFADNSFDAVFAILVINLIQDYRRAFVEIKRVLRPGGVIVFNVPNLASLYFLGGLYVNVRKKTVTQNATGHRFSHWFTYNELRKMLMQMDLSIEKVKGQHPLVRRRHQVQPLDGKKYISRLCSKSIYIRAKLISTCARPA